MGIHNELKAMMDINLKPEFELAINEVIEKSYKADIEKLGPGMAGLVKSQWEKMKAYLFFAYCLGAKAQAVPEGFGLFDGDTLTYSNGYSINCSFDDEFDCHIFDVYQNEDCVKDGMTQLEQAHCLVLSMIKLDAKDSMIEAQEQKG